VCSILVLCARCQVGQAVVHGGRLAAGQDCHPVLQSRSDVKRNKTDNGRDSERTSGAAGALHSAKPYCWCLPTSVDQRRFHQYWRTASFPSGAHPPIDIALKVAVTDKIQVEARAARWTHSPRRRYRDASPRVAIASSGTQVTIVLWSRVPEFLGDVKYRLQPTIANRSQHLGRGRTFLSAYYVDGSMKNDTLHQPRLSPHLPDSLQEFKVFRD